MAITEVTVTQRPERKMRGVGQTRVFPIGAAVLLCCCASTALTQEAERSSPEFKIEAGVGTSDNLNRTEVPLESDIGTLGIGFAGRTDRPRFSASIASDIEYRYYEADDLEESDEVLGSVDAVLSAFVIPDYLSWDLTAGYGQVRIDPLGAVGPSNRQTTTSFTTGPRLAVPLGQRTSLQMGVTASEQNFDATSALDGRLTTTRIGIERRLNPTATLTLSYVGDETEYDLSDQTFDIETVSIEYKRELASGTALARIGRGQLDIDGETEPTTVAQVVWNRSVGTRSRIEFCAGRELTEAGSLFAGAGVAAGCPGDVGSLSNASRTTVNRVQEVVSTTNPLVRSGGSISFEISGDASEFRATVSVAEDRFEGDSTFDNDSTILELTASREFGRAWRAEITARRWIQDFFEQDNENEDQTLGVSLTREIGRSLRLTLSAEQNKRVGGLGEFDAIDYFLRFGREFGR